MIFIEKFFIINIILGFLSFITLIIFSELRNINEKKKQEFDEYDTIMEKKFDESLARSNNNSGLETFKRDDVFYSFASYLLISFVPFLNILLILRNLHNIFYVFKK